MCLVDRSDGEVDEEQDDGDAAPLTEVEVAVCNSALNEMKQHCASVDTEQVRPAAFDARVARPPRPSWGC